MASDIGTTKKRTLLQTILQDLKKCYHNNLTQMMVDVIVDVILSDNQTSETFVHNLLKIILNNFKKCLDFKKLRNGS
jgi:hypothetical protein